MRTLPSLCAALFLLTCLSNCAEENASPVPTLEVPDTYVFTRAGNSTVDFSGQTTRIAMAEALAAALLDFDRTEEELDNMFTNAAGTAPFANPDLNASTKSLRSKVAASRDLFFTNATAAAAIKTDFDGWIAAQVSEVFPASQQLAAPGQPGQLADGGSVRYVSGWGLEYDQAFTKGLIGALMYDQLANHYLSPAVLDEGTNRAANDLGDLAEGKPYTTMEHKWDEAFGYLFGAAANPAEPLNDLEEADDFLNKYLGRVDNDPDFAGIARSVEQAFRVGRAAIVAGDYAERDAQAGRIKTALAEVLAIRAIYYLKQAETALNATPTDRGAAFHDLSEAYGFLYALRFAGTPLAEVTDYLDILRNAGGNGFWDLNPSLLDGIAFDIAARYGIEVVQAAN